MVSSTLSLLSAAAALSSTLVAAFPVASVAPSALPTPYTPPGGLGTNSTPPVYHPVGGDYDFDFQSLALALHQEYIELDLFNYALVKFSPEEFAAAGLNDEHTSLLRFMGQQEEGHAELISNILGPDAPKACTYKYDFETVEEFLEFSMRLTRWGESGVYGFLAHLESRPSATLLTQSITTEARQQMIFRQFQGLFPMPVYFETGIPQSWAWTLLAPYIVSCPADNLHLVWENFPVLNVTDAPTTIDVGYQQLPYPSGGPGITHNRTALTYAGKQIDFTFDAPGSLVGPVENGTYTTSIGAMVNSTAAGAKMIWVSQLNATYTDVFNWNATSRSGSTIQPNGTVFADLLNDPVVNGSMFVALVDLAAPFLTSFNLSMINPYMIAGPAVYEAA